MKSPATQPSRKQMSCLTQAYFSRQEQSLQECELAFFFLDIREFTPLIASRPVLEVFHLLQDLFKIFHQEIASQGGRIIETAGDGLYAVFGLEQALQEATSAALQAGFCILKQLRQANQSYFEPLYNHCFEVGIGLNVGKAIVGKLGLAATDRIAVMGYAVNIAARLQQATKLVNNNFLISEQAYSLLAQTPVASCERLALKGIDKEVNVYLVGEAYSPVSTQEASWKVAC